MTKRASLSSMVKAAAGAPAPVAAPRRAPKPKAATPEQAPEEGKAEGGSRVGRVVFGSYQTTETVKQTKMLAIEQDTTMQALMAEALNLLFQKYGKPTIAKP
jgi:hypothetical protein